MPCQTCMKLRRKAVEAIGQGDGVAVTKVAKQAAGHTLKQMISRIKGERR